MPQPSTPCYFAVQLPQFEAHPRDLALPPRRRLATPSHHRSLECAGVARRRVAAASVMIAPECLSAEIAKRHPATIFP
jgi:hypothetical protein